MKVKQFEDFYLFLQKDTKAYIVFNPIYPKEFLLDLLWNPKGREVTLICYDFQKHIQTLKNHEKSTTNNNVMK